MNHIDTNVCFCGVQVTLFTADLSPGWILIDRCGKHFGTILNYLRDGVVPLPESRRETEELLAEAKYYLVQGLVDECQAALQVQYRYNTSKWIVCAKMKILSLFISCFKPIFLHLQNANYIVFMKHERFMLLHLLEL